MSYNDCATDSTSFFTRKKKILKSCKSLSVLTTTTDVQNCGGAEIEREELDMEETVQIEQEYSIDSYSKTRFIQDYPQTLLFFHKGYTFMLH